MFWIKMSIVGLLLLNGAVLVFSEGAARVSSDQAWVRLRIVSAVSLVLWLSALLAGTWLTVAA